MRQGTVITKIIFLLLLLALIAYAVAAAVMTMSKSITTVPAIAYEVGDGFQTTGYVVRDEMILTAPSGISVLLRNEGERVAKNETIAATYADTDAQEAQRRIDVIEKELSQYEEVLEDISIAEGNVLLDEQIQQGIQYFAAQTIRGDLSTEQTSSGKLKSLVLRRYLDDTERKNLQEQAHNLSAELAGLRARLNGAVTQISAKKAGYFSGSTDGYENILTPKNIMTMSPEEVDALSTKEPDIVERAIGRLIISPQWYFVCCVPETELAGSSVGDRLQVEFAYDFPTTLSMRIERISEPVDGKQVLVLSCEDYVSDATCLRAQSADIVLHTYSGIRVPKQTLSFNNETSKPGVFILEGARVKWKEVQIIYEAADYYIVAQDKSDTNNLWTGDDIILTKEELKDGKVID